MMHRIDLSGAIAATQQMDDVFRQLRESFDSTRLLREQFITIQETIDTAALQSAQVLAAAVDAHASQIGQALLASNERMDSLFADITRSPMAELSISKLIDPAIFSVGAPMQAFVDSMKMPAIDIDALTSVSGMLKQFEGYRFAIDSQFSSIFQDLAKDALASLRTYPFATAATAAAGLPDDLALEDFIEAKTVSDEPDDDAQRVPFVPTRFRAVMFACVLALTIWLLTLGDEGLSREQMQQSMNTLAVGVLGGLIVWLVLNQPPNDN